MVPDRHTPARSSSHTDASSRGADHAPHDHGAHDHGAHDHGAHDHAAHDHAAHDHGAHDHATHGHGAHDHSHGPGGYVSVAIAAVALAIGYGIDVFGTSLPWWSRSAAFGVAILATAPAILPAAWAGVVRGRTLDINALVAIATLGAITLGDWSEGATVAFLFVLGEAIEEFTFARTRRMVSTLLDVLPDTAHVMFDDGSTHVLPVRDIAVGSRIAIKPGGRIPIDGVVRTGSAAVDQSPLTGESLPVDRSVGDEVLAGTVNLNGYLEVETTRPFDSTAVSSIVRVAGSALSGSAHNQRLVQRFARWYTPVVVSLAVAIGVAAPLILGEPVAEWFGRALVLVLVACPCALLMAAPVAVVAAVGNASRHGVVVRTAGALEAAGTVNAVGFDKTGTLTHGSLDVVDVQCIPDVVSNAAELLHLAGAAESRSEHPVGVALVRASALTRQDRLTVDHFRSVTGAGVVATVDGREVAVGRDTWIASLGAAVGPIEAHVVQQEAAGRRAVVVALADGPEMTWQVAGVIAVADRVRSEAHEAVAAVRSQGGRVVQMISGDTEPAAQAVAARVGISSSDVRASLLPQGKVDAVRALRSCPGVRAVSMVGDGINDAPALAAADVGIAMGVGSAAIARDLADVTIVADDLRRVAWFLDLAVRTRRTIIINVVLALGIKLLVLVFAMLGFANLWMAIAADTGATVLVAINGSRLLAGGPGATDRGVTALASATT
jgi:Cd2+/Zn2+-exporting ATPase